MPEIETGPHNRGYSQWFITKVKETLPWSSTHLGSANDSVNHFCLLICSFMGGINVGLKHVQYLSKMHGRKTELNTYNSGQWDSRPYILHSHTTECSLQIDLPLIGKLRDHREVSNVIYIGWKASPSDDLTKFDRSKRVLSKVIDINNFLLELRSRIQKDSKKIKATR